MPTTNVCDQTTDADSDLMFIGAHMQLFCFYIDAAQMMSKV